MEPFLILKKQNLYIHYSNFIIMTKKATDISITKIVIICFVVIILVILTCPRLSLQTRFEGGQSDFKVNYPDTAKLTLSVWNRGGVISDWKIITPESCISAEVSNNVACTHVGFSGTVPCTTAICGPTKAQECGPTDEMSFTFDNPYPNNFTFTLYAQSSFSIIPIKKMTESYYCSLNEDGYSYNCSKI